MKRRRLQLVAALLAVGITAGLIAQLGLGGNGKVQIGNGAVAALGRAMRPSDALPQSVLDLPFAERNFASPAGSGSRLLQTQGSLRLYGVPGKQGLLCLVEVDDLAETAGGACADRSMLRTGAIFMADRQEDGSRLVVGLVGDGHTFAEAGGRRATVHGNAFVLAGVRDTRITVGSPSASQQVDIGG